MTFNACTGCSEVNPRGVDRDEGPARHSIDRGEIRTYRVRPRSGIGYRVWMPPPDFYGSGYFD